MQREGTVILKSSRQVLVETPEGVLRCGLRGKLRVRESRLAVPVVGDRVVVSRLNAQEGVLERVLPRRTELERSTAGGRPVLVAANVDRLLVMIASRDPPPRWALVDRMLVAAHRDSLEPAICVNKWDQVREAAAEAATLEECLGVYREVGYATFRTSALDGEGLEAVGDWMRGQVTAFAGHSGVGKSSLLNRIAPGLDLRTADVNEVTGRGRHTTSAVRLIELPFGGYAVDTPGFREFQPVDLPRPELGRHYPEFQPHLSGCRFRDCLHQREPACAVRAAVEAGIVRKIRYDNYLQILGSLPGRAPSG